MRLLSTRPTALVLSHFKAIWGRALAAPSRIWGWAVRVGQESRNSMIMCCGINKARCRAVDAACAGVRWTPSPSGAKLHPPPNVRLRRCIAVYLRCRELFLAGDLVVLQEKMAEYALAATADEESAATSISSATSPRL